MRKKEKTEKKKERQEGKRRREAKARGGKTFWICFLRKNS